MRELAPIERSRGALNNPTRRRTEPLKCPRTIVVNQQRIKTTARWAGVVLAIPSVAFAVVSYSTHWDWRLGDDMVEKVAERFDLSYANDAATRPAGRS